MFGFGKKKKDAPASEAPDQAPGAESEGGALASNRVRIGLLAVVLVAALGYLAYEYLPGFLEEPAPVTQVQMKPKPLPVAAAQPPVAPVPAAAAATPPAPKPAPEPEAKPAPKPEPVTKAEEPKPEPKPAAKPAPKPEPKPVAKPEPKPVAKPEPTPVAKPEPKPAPAAPPEPKPAPVVMAEAPKPAAEPSPAPAAAPTPAPPVAVLPAVAPLRGPPPITPKHNDVMTAVLYGDRESVAQLLDLGRWVDKPDSNGLTPLMAAVLGRDADMVQLLLERGANPNLQAPGGEVALEMARAIGDGASESLLLKAGARY